MGAVEIELKRIRGTYAGKVNGLYMKDKIEEYRQKFHKAAKEEEEDTTFEEIKENFESLSSKKLKKGEETERFKTESEYLRNLGQIEKEQEVFARKFMFSDLNPRKEMDEYNKISKNLSDKKQSIIKKKPLSLIEKEQRKRVESYNRLKAAEKEDEIIKKQIERQKRTGKWEE